MADEKPKETPFDLREKITVYAPKKAKWHAEGQATKISIRQKAKFLSMGYTETAPEPAAPKKADEPAK